MSDLGGATVFHTRQWAETISATYGYQLQYIVVKDADGQAMALVPLMEVKSALTGTRGVCLPFTDECPPIVAGGTDVDRIWHHLLETGRQRGWKYLEIRGGDFPDFEPGEPSPFVTHTLELNEDADSVFRTFRESTRRNIRKAVKEDVQVFRADTTAGMEDFYLLNCLTRRRHGLPPQPREFFQNLYRLMIAEGMGRILLARHGGKVIAGAVFLHYGDDVMYKYGASRKAHQAMRANNLIMWEAIESCAREGFGTFSFGRSDLGNKGLRQFKAGWGTVEKPLRYWKYDFSKNALVSDLPGVIGWYNTVFSRMPLPALRLAGRVLYRHMG